MKIRMLILLAACVAASPAMGFQSPPVRTDAVPRGDRNVAELSQRIDTLRRTSAELRAAARQPLPRNLTPAETDQARNYIAWLSTTSRRLDALAAEGEKALEAGAPQETRMSFNLQYLQLQDQMQRENRSYTAISNIMKTKHDTVKNSISNVR
jgi:hypothetical protein